VLEGERREREKGVMSEGEAGEAAPGLDARSEPFATCLAFERSCSSIRMPHVTVTTH
jgi:hypothetical protein